MSAAVAGCMVGPDYTRPPIDAPKAYLYEPKDAAVADLEWWKRFDDPVLDRLIADALANNRNIKIAAANVEQAAGVVTSVKSPLYPQVGYQGNAGRARFSQNGTSSLPDGVSNPTAFYQVLAGASWEIDLWGKVRRQTEAAQANLLATEEARRGVILTLVANVAASYLQLRGLDEQLAMAQRTLKTYRESLDLMELRFKYGRVSEMNVEQARARYETAAAQIPQIRRDIAVLEDSLSILVGKPPGPIPRGKSIFELTPPPIPGGIPSELLERRPDLLQAEQQLIAANALIGAAKAQYFPSISLTAALGTASTDLSNLFKGPARTWSFAGSLVGPIFTGGLIAGQVAQAEAGQKAALISYELAIQNAFADVDSALVTRETLAEQVAAQEKLVMALRGYSKLAKMLFDGGRESYTTVLQAEQQLFPAELDWASAQAKLCVSLVGIYKAMGGGWVTTADRMTGEQKTAAQ
ncbi:MAG: efflux transporter outer membrane subunit [Burkholderiales bacterium]